MSAQIEVYDGTYSLGEVTFARPWAARTSSAVVVTAGDEKEQAKMRQAYRLRRRDATTTRTEAALATWWSKREWLMFPRFTAGISVLYFIRAQFLRV